ncbi:PRC-barrel domain protein [Planctomycetes bacterium Poly30]|uniref:PRC-barrel domain protein n=1 Tax=Saltatorellus ferox TaxID=2528018 RepID=A0A518ET91_9BACT|nr:PRC-barrel domain protein [Planctomycetes bacterium Poly30]
MTTHQAPRLLSSSSFEGTKVRNLDKKDIGHIKDLMINLHTGRVAYAVLSFGGFMGLGNKLFAVPFEAFKLDTGDEELILDARKDVLEKMKGFDEDNWPDFADPEFHTHAHAAWNTKPSWTLK